MVANERRIFADESDIDVTSDNSDLDDSYEDYEGSMNIDDEEGYSGNEKISGEDVNISAPN